MHGNRACFFQSVRESDTGWGVGIMGEGEALETEVLKWWPHFVGGQMQNSSDEDVGMCVAVYLERAGGGKGWEMRFHHERVQLFRESGEKMLQGAWCCGAPARSTQHTDFKVCGELF